jgi:cobalamin synthase
MSEKDRYEAARQRMRRDNMVFLAFVTLLGIAVIVEYWLGIGGAALTVTIIMLILLAAFAVIRFSMADRMLKRMPEYLQDERTRKIDYKARSLSWYMSFLLVCVLILLTAFHIVEISAYSVVALLFFVMLYSWIVFKWYYGRKGDVE